MPRLIHNALTATRINALRPKAAPYTVADGAGLYLRVMPTGSKQFLQRYQAETGKRANRGLGGWPETTLASARDAAYMARRELAGAVRTQRAVVAYVGAPAPVAPLAPLALAPASTVPTFGQACRIVLASEAAQWKSGPRGKSARDWLKRIKVYVPVAIRRLPVSDIRPAHILEILQPVWTTKAETGRKLRVAVSRVMDWAAAAEHYTRANPVPLAVRGLPSNASMATNYEAMPYADVPAFVRELHGMDNGAVTQLALEFAILTIMRSGNVRGAKWSHIAGDLSEWRVPGEDMKNGQPHTVPLAPRAQEILRTARAFRREGSDLVFPGTRQGEGFSDMTLTRLLRRGGHTATVHGFRSSFADWAGECTDYAEEIREAALAHAVADKTVRAYKRTTFLEKRRALMREWAAFVTGGEPAKLALVA